MLLSDVLKVVKVFIFFCQAQSVNSGAAAYAVAKGLYVERSCRVHRLALRWAMGTFPISYLLLT